jgi:hypothetical protein
VEESWTIEKPGSPPMVIKRTIGPTVTTSSCGAGWAPAPAPGS